MVVIVVFLSIHYVIAAPTLAPPDGNPTFPLQGEQGIQGDPGPAGTFGTCTSKVANCSYNYNGSCSIQVNADSGWKVTGGLCRTTDTRDAHEHNGWGGTYITCQCYGTIGNGTCSAVTEKTG